MSASDQKKVVIIGSGGRLGRCLLDHLSNQYQVTSFDRHQMDLSSPDSIESGLRSIDYDHVFITGALTAVDYCETHSSEAEAINADAPARIAKISRDKNSHVTYISTDMVFDGSKREAYVETDTASPISVYGLSKLHGEDEVLSASDQNLVVRVSWVFGPTRPAFPEWIIRQACLERELTLPSEKICCPTFTPDLVDWIESLALHPSRPPASGIFHLCNPDPCSWRDWGQNCIDAARAAGLPIQAGEIRGGTLDNVESFIAKRPVNSAMNTDKFTAHTQITPRRWPGALSDFLIQNLPNLMYYVRANCG